MDLISVIVPTHKCPSPIAQCLEAIRKSNYKGYELIVVNSAGDEATSLIAGKLADKIINVGKTKERSVVRTAGILASSGQIIVNVDSDVVIKTDTLAKISDFFSKHQQIDALTGLLSKEHPNKDFFSQYKNLYMHYIFKKLPERVTFLYGSIYALRRKSVTEGDFNVGVADDTALGQKLVRYGKKIAFLKDLEVMHLKKHNLLSFFKNDFRVPFDWAYIFLRYDGWKQLGKNNTGYAHSPKEQIISVILALAICPLAVVSFFWNITLYAMWGVIVLWVFLNVPFFKFLAKEKGIVFLIGAFFVTFFDNIIMALGILSGFLVFFLSGRSQAA